MPPSKRAILTLIGLLALLATVPSGTQAQAPVETPERWQADLVLSSAGPGDPLYFPNDFIENTVTDELLVADSYNNRILRYAATTVGSRHAGDFLGVIDGSSDGQAFLPFQTPYGIAIDAQGNILVANKGTYEAPNDVIQVLSPDGSTELFQTQLSLLTGDPLSSPYRVALAPGTVLNSATGTVYVIDGGANQVLLLDPQLTTVVRAFGAGFAAPTGLAVDAQGRVYVSDPNNNRVQVFSDPLAVPQGTDPALVASLCGFGDGCTVDTPLAYPFGLAVDANGRLLVADASNNRIAVYSAFADGLQPINASIGVATTGLVNGPPGCDISDASNPCLPDYDPTGLVLPSDSYLADLQGPTNIELDHLGHLLVADSSNMRVQRFVQPAMTLTAGSSGSSFATGDTIAVTVIAATTEPAGLTNVSPNAQPLAFSGGSCGSGSSSSLVTTPTPTTYQVGTGPVTSTPPTLTLLPGSPITFTMTFVAASGSGPLVFNAGATGQLSSGAATSQQRNLDSIAINDTGLPPSTTFTSTPASPNGTLITTPGELGWFVGTVSTVIHVSGANASEIDYSVTDQDPEHLEPSSYQVQCGGTQDVEISREGHTLVWYRSVSPSGQTEAWHKLMVHRSFGPGVGLTLTPAANANGWNNTTVNVAWAATDVVAGLKQIDWTGSGGVTGSTTTLDTSSFPVSVQGAALAASVTATSNSGATSSANASFRIDKTPPVVGGTHAINVINTATAAVPSNGWYKTGLDVVFSATDNLSGFTSGGALTATQTVSLSAEGSALSAQVTFTDQAGNSASATVPGLKIDMTLPTIAVSTVNASGVAISPTAAGWFNAATGRPTVKFTPSDALSGLPTGTTAQSVPVTADTLGATLTSNAFADLAGNSATASFAYKVDTVLPTLTAPVLVGPAGIVANALGYFDLTGRTDGVAVNVTAADAAPGSGVAQVCYDLTGGTTCTPAAAGSGVGAYTLTVLSSVANARIWSVDAAGNASAARLFTVNITRNAPIANGQAFATPVNTNYAGTVTSTGGGGVSYTVATAPMTGSTLTLGTNGSFTYAPKANYTGPDSFVFRVTDTVTGANTTATVSITVGNGTLPPVAANKAFTTNEDTALTIPAASIVTDGDTPSAGLTLTVVTPPGHGTAVASGAAMLYTPAADYNGADSFTFRASDPDGNVSNTATISMTVSPVNDTPSFTPGPSQTVNEDAAPVSVSNWATNINKGAANESAQAVDFIVTNGNAALFSAQPAISAAGTLTYTVAANANGVATVTVKIHDNGLGADTSAPVTFTITVNPVNDAPSFTAGPSVTVAQNAGAQTIDWATTVSAGPNEPTQTVAFLVSNSNNALFSAPPAISPAGTLTFTPLTGATGSATVTVKLQDNGGTLNGGVDTSAAVTFVITVNSANRPPVATADAASTPTGTPVVVNVLANDSDPDGDALTIKSVVSPTAKGGTAVISGGKVTYTPPPSLARGGTDTFTYTVADSKGATASATMTITIVNRAPVAVADSVTLFKGDSVTFSVLANDTDADRDTLKVTATTNPAHGTISVRSNGTIKYTAQSRYAGSDSFTYTINDGHGGTAIGTVTITIKSHYDGDGCSHDRSHGWHDDDDCDHDRDTDRRHDSRWRR